MGVLRILTISSKLRHLIHAGATRQLRLGLELLRDPASV